MTKLLRSYCLSRIHRSQQCAVSEAASHSAMAIAPPPVSAASSAIIRAAPDAALSSSEESRAGRLRNRMRNTSASIANAASAISANAPDAARLSKTALIARSSGGKPQQMPDILDQHAQVRGRIAPHQLLVEIGFPSQRLHVRVGAHLHELLTHAVA